MGEIQMLEYDRTAVSEAIDINRTDSSCKWIICQCWYFFMINFRFQPKACDDCHDVAQKSASFNDAAVATIKGSVIIGLTFGSWLKARL